AGALDKNRALKLKKAKHKQGKQRARGATPEDEVKTLAQKAQAEKIERDREINRKHQQTMEEKALRAQVRQLVERNQIHHVEGDSSYNFVDNGVVKKINLNAELHRSLANGSVAIARLDDTYVLVPAGAARKIIERSPEVILVLNDKSDNEVIDDQYAAYEIPDDLSW
ncbi:MAG: DUF2058 domain-containing protein, partial [Proteobacteria bacterium]|nr:DUF2058 domain-containing protein [Pseudomonadota bacterium]